MRIIISITNIDRFFNTKNEIPTKITISCKTFIMKNLVASISQKTVVLIFSVFIFSSCFSTYPIQRKFPCDETTTEEKLKMINAALDDQLKPKTRELKEDGVTFGKRSFKFDEVRYVRAKTKPFITGRKYWIQIREFNGDMNVIYLRDFETMEKANNALMCLTDLQDTNGRPKQSAPKSNIQQTDKYDKLEKLKKLYDSGAITREEYEKEKKVILGN